MEGYGNLLTKKEGGEEGGIESKIEGQKEIVGQLQSQVSQMQRQCQFLQYKYLKAKEESALNAQALRQKIGDLEEIRVELEQVSEECQFYQEDREIFALAAEEAEEQCVEAERRALDAEKRTMEARRREKVALELVEQLMTNSSPLNVNNLTHIRSLKEGRAIDPLRSAFIDYISDLRREHGDAYITSTPTKKQAAYSEYQSPGLANAHNENAGESTKQSTELNSSHNNRNILSKTNTLEDIGASQRKMNQGMCIESENTKVITSVEGNEENLKISEMTTTEEEEMERRLGMKMKELIQMLTIGQKNLLKAELEADVIQRKYSELRKLLTDILVAFGILEK